MAHRAIVLGNEDAPPVHSCHCIRLRTAPGRAAESYESLPIGCRPSYSRYGGGSQRHRGPGRASTTHRAHMQGEKTMYQVRKVAAGGMLAAAAVTGGAIGATLIGNANAATPSTAASSSTSSSAASPGVPQARGSETALTGDTLAKA